MIDDDEAQEIVDEALETAITDATYEDSWFTCEWFASMTCGFSGRLHVDVWPTYMLN
jgi:hypothetical protein